MSRVLRQALTKLCAIVVIAATRWFGNMEGITCLSILPSTSCERRTRNCAFLHCSSPSPAISEGASAATASVPTSVATGDAQGGAGPKSEPEEPMDTSPAVAATPSTQNAEPVKPSAEPTSAAVEPPAVEGDSRAVAADGADSSAGTCGPAEPTIESSPAETKPKESPAENADDR